MTGARTSKKRSPPRRQQSAANYYRAIRRKFETLRIEAGETPAFRKLTMATHRPRKKIRARVVRESDWNLIMAVVCTAWSASPEADSGRELLISDAVQRLNDHLERRRDRG